MEFSLVGIQGRRERVIGPNRTVGGSSRERATYVPPDRICRSFWPRLLEFQGPPPEGRLRRDANTLPSPLVFSGERLLEMEVVSWKWIQR